MKKEFRNFNDARKFVRKLNLKGNKDWRVYCKSGNKPADIPSTPEKTFKKEWTDWGDWLGTGTVAAKDKKFRSFLDAKKFVRTLNLKTDKEWVQYTTSGNKPTDIPSSPITTYKNKGWGDMGDWLGTGSLSNQKKVFQSFDDARKFVRLLNLKAQSDWAKYRKSGNKPETIPSNPNRTYKKEWTDWGDWLGTGATATQNREYWSFTDARKFARSLNLKSGADWEKYCASGNKPENIPNAPRSTYKKEWISMGDWLGTGNKHTKDFLSFEDARQFVQKIKLKNNTEWIKYYKSDNRPDNIPSAPERVYKNKGWITLGDWLGTDNVAAQKKKFRSFNEAKKFVQSLGLKNYDDWKQYCASGNKPDDIPSNPWITYKEWKKK
jgi:hypothetical protein